MTNLPTLIHTDEEVSSVQRLREILLLPDDAQVSLDAAYSVLTARGWHILEVDGYNPAAGGPASYLVQGVSADGSYRMGGHGSTLRAAFLDLAAKVLE